MTGARAARAFGRGAELFLGWPHYLDEILKFEISKFENLRIEEVIVHIVRIFYIG